VKKLLLDVLVDAVVIHGSRQSSNRWAVIAPRTGLSLSVRVPLASRDSQGQEVSMWRLSSPIAGTGHCTTAGGHVLTLHP